MATYYSDRQFTNYIHEKIAISHIYNLLQWDKINLETSYAEKIDMQDGIDYIFQHKGEFKTVQERFREKKYSAYSDFTIRYRRDNNQHEDRRASEYSKMKADYFTYGITNGTKSEVENCTDFIKYAVIDLSKVYQKIDNREIIISDNGKNKCQIIENGVLECPIKYNVDGSSSFFPIEIPYLLQLFGDDLIIAQKGFL